jgi:hypothetical protein
MPLLRADAFTDLRGLNGISLMVILMKTQPFACAKPLQAAHCAQHHPVFHGPLLGIINIALLDV